MEGKLRSKMYVSGEKTGGGLSEVLRDVASNQQDQDNEREEMLSVENQNEEMAEHSYLMIVGNSSGNEENQADNCANNSKTLLNNEKLHKSFPCRMRDCQKRFFHKAVYKKHKKGCIRRKQLMWDRSGIFTAPGNVNEKKIEGVSFQDELINDAESKHEEDDDVITDDESNDSDVNYEGSQKSSTLKDKYPEDNTTDESYFSDGDNDEENDDPGSNEEFAMIENKERQENLFSEAKIAEVMQSATCVSGAGEDEKLMITETQVLSPTCGPSSASHHSRINPLTQRDFTHAESRSKVPNKIYSNQEPPLNEHAKTKNVESVSVEPLIFKCEVCAHKLRSKSGYYAHMARVHKPPKSRITCPTCARVFSRRRYLKAHIAHVHTNRSERKFQCPIEDCGKRFVYQVYLTRHMVVHESPNPLTCPTCATVFKNEQNLKAHICQGRGKDSKRKYQCPIENCGKSFLYPTHVKQHMVVHESPKQLPCPNCDKVFTSEKYLKAHTKNIHAKGSEPKCQCPEKYCESRFPCPLQLKNHIMEFHTHQKWFMCDRCGKYFGYRRNLKRHVEKRSCGSSAAGPSSD